MADDTTTRIRGAQAMPTAAEHRELVRRAKALAAAGDPRGVHALALLTHADELRRHRLSTPHAVAPVAPC